MSQSARRVLLCVVLALLPGTVHALGLGKLTVLSSLGERLDAYIEFTSLTEHEVKTLRADIVKRSDVLPATGVEPTSLSPDIGVTLVAHEDGQYTLQLYSEQPFREPFIRLLLEVDWAGGRLIREFVALVDPAIFDDGPEGADAASITEAGATVMPDTATPVVVAMPSDAGPNRLPIQPHATSASATKASAPDTTKPSAAEHRPARAHAATAAPPGPEKRTPSAAQTTKLSADKRDTKLPADEREGGTQPRATPSPTRVAAPATETKAHTEVAATESDVAAEHRRLKSEIETWAKAQHQAKQQKAQSPESEHPGRTVAPTKTTDAPVAAPGGSSVRPASPPQPHKPTSESTLPRIGDNASQWWMISRLAIAGLILTVCGIVLFLYLRRDTAKAAARLERIPASAQERLPVQAVPVIHDRRSGRGRRRRFVPVPFERRRGPRRLSDQIPDDLSEAIETTGADTEEEGDAYLASGKEEHAEKTLKDAIAENPDRQSLKVKLLSVYYLRQNKEAFEDLANQLYAELEPGRAGAVKSPDRTTDEQDPGESDWTLQENTELVWTNNAKASTPTEPEPEFSLDLLDTDEPKGEQGLMPDEDDLSTQPLRTDDLDRTNRDNRTASTTEAGGESESGDQEREPAEQDEAGDDKKAYERDLEKLDTALPTVEDEATEILFFDDVPDEPPVKDEVNEQAENTEGVTDRGMAALKVDNFDEIKDTVPRGANLIEKEELPTETKKSHKRSRKGRRKKKSTTEENTQSKEAKQAWKDPAAKIDLAKAYIDRGDPEHARSLLDDVLKNWSED